MATHTDVASLVLQPREEGQSGRGGGGKCATSPLAVKPQPAGFTTRTLSPQALISEGCPGQLMSSVLSIKCHWAGT